MLLLLQMCFYVVIREFMLSQSDNNRAVICNSYFKRIPKGIYFKTSNSSFSLCFNV